MTITRAMSRSNIQLRPYQQEALASIPDAGAYLIQMAVGLGKTVTFSQIPRRGRMLILSHRDELVHQPAKYFDCSFGVEQAGETSHGEEVVSASVQSLVRRLDKFKPDDFDILITDECFPAGTLVDGRPIEEIKVGDYVTAYNFDNLANEKRKVLRVFERFAPKTLIRINHELCCTLNHPIYTPLRDEYKEAGELRLGDSLFYFIDDGSDELYEWEPEPCVAEVKALELIDNQDKYVYNLEVEGLNNYFANGYLVHNCHHAAAPTYRKIYDYFTPRLHLGFTATPNRNDGIGLQEIYQDIIFQRDLKWGIKNGYLSNIKCLRVDIGYDISRVAMRLGDYAANELDEAVNIEKANKAVAEAYKLYAKPPCLIFCASVSHAENLAALIPDAVAVRGGEDRMQTVQDFQSGKIPCLTNCMVFTEGTDIPNINTIIMARPTKNASLYQQAIGRGTRLYPGKDHVLIIDCVGVSKKLDFCTAPSLIGLDISEVPPRNLYKVQGDLFDLPDIVMQMSDCPEAWIRNVEYVDLWARNSNYNLHGVNYFKHPDGTLTVLDRQLPPDDFICSIEYDGALLPAKRVFDLIYEILKED
ncbi:MAG: DEAD/DEAH box helicase family protein, partial [Synergistaceae bacterium]|nr:DEAD/DEAH box helicase family protein [Synergistaceae bacterium]